MHKLQVSDIMTREPLVAKPDSFLLDCVKKMVKKKVGSILLVKDKRLVGLISQKDVMWALTKKSKKDLKEVLAIDISPKKLATIKPSMPIKDVIEKMKKLKFGRLPVIHEGELVGLVTLSDILNFHPEMYPELDEFDEIRERAAKLKRIRSKERKYAVEGICEECGNHDLLQKTHGMLLCESCRNLS